MHKDKHIKVRNKIKKIKERNTDLKILTKINQIN